MSQQLKASQLDLSNVKFSSLRTMDNGGKMVYLNYGDGIAPIYLQTPEVDLPFDPSYFADNETSGKYSIKFSMKGHDSEKAMKDFHDKLCEMDELLKGKALENCFAWFKKQKMSADTIDTLYTPLVKVSVDKETGEPDGKYAPQCGFKLVKRDGKFQCSVYDNQKNNYDINKETENPVDVENVLTKGAKVKAVLRCTGVWIANGKFGCGWRAEQIRVKVPEAGLREYAIMSDSEDEDTPEVEETQTNLIDDSDDDDEPEKVEEVEKKKPVTKSRKVKISKK
jgi:hypothetical protein